MVSDPAAADDAGVHGHIWEHRLAVDGWAAAVSVLSIGDGDLDLFWRVFEEDLGYLCSQCGDIRQSVFSAAGHADLGGDLEPHHLCDPIRPFFGISGLFLYTGSGRAHDILGVAAASFYAADGGVGVGFWHHHILSDNQIPGFALPGGLWGAAMDVCHTGHLPGFQHTGRVALGVGHQPGDPHCGSFSLRLPGGGQRQLGFIGLQFCLHAGGVHHWRVDLQPGGKHLHGYRIIPCEEQEMSRTVISVEHLSKRYELGVIGATSLQRDLNRWWARVRGRPDPYLKIGQEEQAKGDGEHIWALDDISFEVQQGEALGIIGRNGAGKSTLLKILSQVTAPTAGRVKVKGRIGALLEVGTGFHPELTGRENIYLNGAILGMTKGEVDRKFDEIVDFSGVEKFIDTPVKRYSSGMYVRLAFSVAAHLDPEILVVDEVLAVGDAEFQKKCLGKMGDVTQEGRTVLFVSHNMATIQELCGKTLLLSNGSLKYIGKTDLAIDRYMKTLKFAGSANIELPTYAESELCGLKINIKDLNGHERTQFKVNEPFMVDINFDIRRDTPSVIAAVGLTNERNVSLNTQWSKPMDLKPGKYQTSFVFNLPLNPMQLSMNIGVSSRGKAIYYKKNVGLIAIEPIHSDLGKPALTLRAGVITGKQESTIQHVG